MFSTAKGANVIDPSPLYENHTMSEAGVFHFPHFRLVFFHAPWRNPARAVRVVHFPGFSLSPPRPLYHTIRVSIFDWMRFILMKHIRVWMFSDLSRNCHAKRGDISIRPNAGVERRIGRSVHRRDRVAINYTAVEFIESRRRADSLRYELLESSSNFNRIVLINSF